MMQIALPRSWKEEFALAAAMRREDILHKEKMARLEALSRQRVDEVRLEQKRREQDLAALEAALAPPQQIVEFRTRLDTYDTKTVESLMDNQEAMEVVRRKIDDMLGRAEVLPDGRKVFKTLDGQKVMDEHGQEVSPDIINPASIDDKKPRWETFKAETDAWVRLNEERQQLIDYQGKLDNARERLDRGEITEQELKELGNKLDADMPETVRAKLNLDKPENDAAQKLDSDGPTLPSNMDSLMQQTGFAPAAPAMR